MTLTRLLFSLGVSRRCQGRPERRPSGAVKAKKIFIAALTLNGPSSLALSPMQHTPEKKIKGRDRRGRTGRVECLLLAWCQEYVSRLVCN